MKVKKLVVKGFMRFKEQQEINFPEGQVTLVFGENGAGKTSLLDAICVGLYGKTFRTSLEPEAGFLTLPDLINHDSPKASIHVEFENYGHQFVVKREISREGSTGELLEDGEVKAQDDTVFDYVNHKSIGLDWQGFTKSTVVLQGEMNALTDSMPATRKETFVKLFGLDKYQKYEQIAKVEMEEKNMSVKEMEAANEVLENEVAKIPQVESSIKRLGKTVARLQKQKDKSGKKLKKMKQVTRNLERDYKQFIKLNEKVDSVTSQISNLEKSLTSKKDELKHLQSLRSDLAGTEKDYNELNKLTKNLKGMQTKKTKYDRMQNRLESLQGSLKSKKKELSELNNEMSAVRSEISGLKKDIPSAKQVKTIREEMAKLEKTKVELEGKRYQLDALLAVSNERLGELKSHLNNVKRKHTCPVCTQKLSDVRKLADFYSSEIKSITKDIKKHNRELKSVQSQLRKIDQKLTDVEESKSKLESIYSKQDQLYAENERLEELNTKRDKLKKEIDRIDSHIAKQKKELGSLSFNPKEYDTMEKKLNNLRQQKVAEKFSSIQTQVKQLPQVEREIKKLENNLAKLEKQKRQFLSKIKKFKDIENKFSKAKEELQVAENAHDQNVVTLTKEQTNYKTLEKQHAELRNKEKKLQSNEDEIEKLRSEMSLFEDLMLVFKDVPENILKRVIPHVEKEATIVINELSQGSISALNIEPDTLNIGAIVGGEVRPIQYFSGGQQTRINMALRVAISRILSRMPVDEGQVSATVQTLFIDEGDFGNLDEAGVRDAMSVIQSLSREFSRIVLISHLESVRSSFQGYTVEVVKITPSQSVINAPMEAISMQH